MSQRHIIKIDGSITDENPINRDVLELIEKNNNIKIKQPKGALGVGETATIIIAISASYQAIRTVVQDIHNSTNNDESTEIHDFESAAKIAASTNSEVKYSNLELIDISKSGRTYEIILKDEQDRNHRIKVDRFDTSLEKVDHLIE